MDAAAAGTIRSIRSSAGSNYTRIIVEVGQATKYNYGTVQGNPAKGLPPRLYVDLHDVYTGKSTKNDLWVGDVRVKRVRTGQHTGTTTRVVLDLEGPVTPSVTALTRPPRIVIELKGNGVAGQSLAKASPTAPARASGGGSVPKAPASAAVKPKAPIATIGPSATRGTSSSAARKGTTRRKRVVIDAGHGGKDPGAKGYQGYSEKHAVVDVAKRLAAKLKSRLGVDVVMTRTDDRYIALEERKDIANRKEADLFVSIHANASENTKLRGIETYYLKNSNDRATLRLAKLENGVDMLIKGRDISADADLPFIISDMVQGQKEADSILLATHIQDELVGYLSPLYHSVRSLGVKQGPFMVLDGTYMPAVLAEIGFISNSLEGRRLTVSSYRDAVAEGLYRGIKRYLGDARVAKLR
jgi:N-acetylmuramoyl-L-alanine amidase